MAFPEATVFRMIDDLTKMTAALNGFPITHHLSRASSHSRKSPLEDQDTSPLSFRTIAGHEESFKPTGPKLYGRWGKVSPNIALRMVSDSGQEYDNAPRYGKSLHAPSR